MRRSIAALALGALLAGGLWNAPAATAQPTPQAVGALFAPAAKLPAPAIKTLGGETSLTVSWSAVPGATGYRIEYGTKSSFSGAKKVTVGATTKVKVLKRLKNDVKYYVRVRAIASGSVLGSVSAAKTAVPDSGTPRPMKITVVPAGRDKVKVSWTGIARATKVGVLAGSDSKVTKNLFRTAWHPATTSSITITVPAALRDEIGTGSGNPVHVKVAAYNSLTAGDAMPTVKNLDKMYRLSPSGTYSFASAQLPAGDLLRVGTWNVRSVGASAAVTGYTWKDRRLKVQKNILASGVSLLGLQEVNTSDAGLGNGKRQWEDLHDLLRPSGWAIANPPSGYPLQPNATNGAHLFYQRSELEVLDGGFVSPRSTPGISWPSGLTDRLWSWAQFRSLKTGATFWAASVHLPVDDSGNDRSKLRVAVAKSVDAFLSRRAGNAPVVILGDLNSTIRKSTTGADNALRIAGYYDAASAVKRSNEKFPTVNSVGQLDNLKVGGFPYTPYKASHGGTRIDYIMVKNAPGSARYVNQLILTPTGKFDRGYQGSDHNLQWAELGLLG
jgi:exonuclease III